MSTATSRASTSASAGDHAKRASPGPGWLAGFGEEHGGQVLALALGASFMDFDEEIERREGATVTEIFDQRGEAAFRAMETALTRELAATTGMVLSPGGGWMANDANVALLRPPARIIH